MASYTLYTAPQDAARWGAAEAVPLVPEGLRQGYTVTPGIGGACPLIRPYGHVTVAKAWQRADGGARHELNIGAGTLDRPIENVTATVLHEMVHLFNLQAGIQDTSRGGTYHNKRFREAAEARDLHISYDKRIGWSVTEPTDALIEFIISQGWDNIMMNRKDGFSMRGVGGPGAKGGPAPATGRTSSTRKLVCPKCGQSVRATKTVNILCGDCLLPMLEV